MVISWGNADNKLPRSLCSCIPSLQLFKNLRSFVFDDLIGDILGSNEEEKPKSKGIFGLFSTILNKTMIKVEKHDDFWSDEAMALFAPDDFDAIDLGPSWTDDYDKMLFSGSTYTGDKLMSMETETLDKFKWNFQEHDHDDHWETDQKTSDVNVCLGDACQHIWGCCEFEDNAVARDKNGDVIDRFHWIHFHKNEKERFRHLKKAKKYVENWKSYKAIVGQLQKIKALKKHFLK